MPGDKYRFVGELVVDGWHMIDWRCDAAKIQQPIFTEGFALVPMMLLKGYFQHFT